MVDGQPRASIVLGVASRGLCPRSWVLRIKRARGARAKILSCTYQRPISKFQAGENFNFPGRSRLVASLLEVSWDPPCGPRWWVCAACYSTSSENRGWAHDGVHTQTCTQTLAFFLPKAHSLACKLASKLMVFNIGYKSQFLVALDAVWRSNLGSF